MKSFKRKGARGRPLKFKPGEIAHWKKKDTYVVVVDHMTSGKAARGLYRCVRLIQRYPHQRYGHALWVGSEALFKVEGMPAANMTRRVWAANQRLVDRGCPCNCCVHTKLTFSDVGKDGTLRWEKEDEEQEGKR